jgi:phosphatidylserine/phosphatidylglycerophosphate/cardiolipin synthase-like enzyme
MKSMKKTLLSLLSLTMVGCGSAPLAGQLPMAVRGMNAPINSMAAPQLRAQAATTNLPFFAMFNDAYKGLLSENEAIGRANPKNVSKYFVNLIDSARQTLDGAFYDIDDVDAVNAFIRAQKRGVRVRLTTEHDSLMDKHNPTVPRKSIAALRAAGIQIHDDGDHAGLMHNKFMIVDNATVWTGSLNLTTSSMYHHNNNSMMIRSPQLAANFNAEFQRLFEQGNYGPNPHTVPNPEVNVSGISIKTFFSPGGNAMTAVHEELRRATKNIRFMAFSMTDKDILQILLEKKAAGVKVEGVFDNCLIPQYSIYWDLKKAGILVLGDGNQALMHHKVMVIDDQTVITGSYNFSKSAQNKNQENMLVIKSPLIAKQYVDEYYKIRTAAFDNKNLPAYDHPACSKQRISAASAASNPAAAPQLSAMSAIMNVPTWVDAE